MLLRLSSAGAIVKRLFKHYWKLAMKIDSHDKKIDELLKGNKFVIPRFQRSYSWEADHVTEFWNDVLANISESYFIGSMVVYKVDRSVRRQSFWNQEQLKLRERLAHLVGLIMRRVACDASGALRASFV